MLEQKGNIAGESLPHDLLVKLQSVYGTLKTAELKAADIIIAEPVFVTKSTIAEMAIHSSCSEATLVRLAKRLGYKGYPEMRECIRLFLDGGETALYKDISKLDTTEEIVGKVFAATVQALNDTLNGLDMTAYESAVSALLEARRLLFCGVGDSYAVAVSGRQKFMRLGVQAFSSTDVDMQLIALAGFTKNDVIIPISYSGRTKSTIDIVKYARSIGVKVIAITNYPTSPLTRLSDIVLQTAAFTQHPTGEIMSKRITQLCLIESLFVSVLTKKETQYKTCLEQTNHALQINKI